MLKNKFKKYLALAASVFVLASCGSSIQALPNDKDEKILDNLEKDLARNILDIVYTQLHDGADIKTQALDDVFLLIAESKFGTYEQIKTDPAKVDLKADFERRINEKLYKSITSGSYESKNKFSEEKFANYVKTLLYPVNPTAGYIDDYVFLPVNIAEIQSGAALNNAIHVEYYQDYIEGEIVPKIFHEKLIEQYVLDEDYATLGRSYARKVNYIALTVNDNHPEAAKYLIDEFIDKYILTSGATADFDLLASAWRGVDILPGSDEDNLLTDAGLDVNKTLMGDILDRFNKIKENALLTDEGAENDFTGGGSYLKEVGLDLKKVELSKRDFITDGWFVKNGGLTSLPDKIRDRIFNTSVASAIDSVTDEFDASITNPKTSSFVRNLNGKYYLIPENRQQNDDRDFLLYDASSRTYFIIQIEEAVNTTKMNKSETATNNYDALKGAGTRERIAQDIAKILGDTTANKNSAREHYIKQLAFQFYDEDIYNYFKAQFPKVFDEDKK